MSLFQKGKFKSHSGLILPFKIDCDYLSDDDLDTLSIQISNKFRIKQVLGIPRGGIRFAESITKYLHPEGQICIVDDVFTTGSSMEEMKSKIGGSPLGIVIFSRYTTPSWIFSCFQLSSWLNDE